MLLTEDEARKKWCPYARLSMSSDSDDGTGFSSASVNRGGGYDAIEENATCLASGCMAWRLGEPRSVWLNEEGQDRAEGASGEFNEERVDRGYCGLAGRPA